VKIAIPTRDGKLCPHFGHCEEFAFLEIDPETKRITRSEKAAAPAHEPGLLPRWLKKCGVGLVIAGGMGARALSLFADNGVEVIVGAPEAPPDQLAESYLDGRLKPGRNVCDH